MAVWLRGRLTPLMSPLEYSPTSDLRCPSQPSQGLQKTRQKPLWYCLLNTSQLQELIAQVLSHSVVSSLCKKIFFFKMCNCTLLNLKTSSLSLFWKPKERIKTRLRPSTICWTASSELYVGCQEGHLLQVDPDSLAVSVLFNPSGTPCCLIAFFTLA